VPGFRGSTATDTSIEGKPRWWQRWPESAPYAAGGWSLLYGMLVLGLYRALGSVGFPFGEGDPQSALSVFGGVRAETGAGYRCPGRGGPGRPGDGGGGRCDPHARARAEVG
jgi:hypothetical protein